MSSSFHVSQVSRGQAFAILGGAALMMTLAMGIRQNLGLFQAPASKELGIAISDFALAISVQQVAWGLSQPFAGIVADKHGTRGIALFGSLLFIAGVVLTATAQGALPIVLGGAPEEMSDLAWLAGLRVRIALQGHAPFAAATQAVHETLKALRDGASPKNLKGLASSELTARAMREADMKTRSADFLGLKK